jgi:uncharacterized protein (DUF427 family)
MADVPDELQAGVEKRRGPNRGRPDKIVVPGPGQESVWDYPRPPRVERVDRTIRVEFGSIVLAESDRAYRVIETASPPVYYLPPDDVRTEYLEPSGRSSMCEWKGESRYWTVRVGQHLAENAAWSYTEPWPGYEAIAGYLAFYAGKMDVCYVGEHRVTPQPGEYYGGWITPDVVGPFKGAPGTGHW